MKKVATIIGALFVGLVLLYVSVNIYAFSTYNAEVARQKEEDSQKSKYELGPPDAQEMLELINEERAKIGVAPLTIDERLNHSALIKAEDMERNHYFGHSNPTTGKHGYEYASEAVGDDCAGVGENITDNLTEEDNNTLIPFKSFMGSKPHHDAMLNPKYSTIGIAYFDTTVVQHFCQLR